MGTSQSRFCAAVALLIAGTTGASHACCDPPQQQKHKTPTEQLRVLTGEFESGRDRYNTALRAATNEEQILQIQADLVKLHQEFATRIYDIAQKHPDDSAARDAFFWLANRAWTTTEGHKALEALLTQGIKKPDIDWIVQMMGRSGSPNTEKVLRAVLAENQNRAVRGEAYYWLAQVLKLRSEALAYDRKSESQALAAEAARVFDILLKEFGDRNSFGGRMDKVAKEGLFELRHLSVGRVAPEIEGSDMDGVLFRLSDYRGNIVLLDFWGDW
jgi:hypothetical protein